jgi:hypothetical protein
VKLDVDTVATVPEAPPAAGPDRALDPPPPDPLAPAAKGPVPAAPPVTVVLDEVVLDDDADEPPQAASATTAINTPARTPIRALLNRRLARGVIVS